MNLKEKIEKEMNDLKTNIESSKEKLIKIHSLIQQKIEKCFNVDCFDEVIVSDLGFYLSTLDGARNSNKIIDEFYVADYPKPYSVYLSGTFNCSINSRQNDIRLDYKFDIKCAYNCDSYIFLFNQSYFEIKENTLDDSSFEEWLWLKIGSDMKREYMSAEGLNFLNLK